MKTLIITVGETPQVVTETVYGLLTQAEPWVPDRIIIATTGKGSDGFRQGVPPSPDGEFPGRPPLTGPDGRLVALYGELGKPALAVDPEITVAHMIDGRRIGDIRSDEEVNAFADMLLELVAGVTADDTCELHLSLAGGRKTMSFIAGQVMALHGRAQDVMSHVLVEPAKLESLASFWWPGQKKVVIDRDGKAVDANAARIVLHAVPYIRLKAFLELHDLFPSRETGYADAVNRANAGLAVDSVILDFTDCSVTAGHLSVKMDYVVFAALATILAARKMGAVLDTAYDHLSKQRPSLNGNIDEALRLWRWTRGMTLLHEWFEEPELLVSEAVFENLASQKLTDLEQENFRTYRSRASRALKAWPKKLAMRILVAGSNSTELDPSKIKFIVPSALQGSAPWE